MGGEAWVLDLRDSKACDSTQTGAKAANLAIAGAAGLPVLDGIVLTVEGVQGLQRPGCTRVLATLRSTARRFEDAPLVVAVVVDGRGRRDRIDGRPIHLHPRRAGLGRVA